LAVGRDVEKGRCGFLVKKPNSIVSVFFLLVLLVGSLVVGFWVFHSFLKPFAFAGVIAIGSYPLFLRISRYVHGSNKTALLATFAVLLIFALPALLIASTLGAELIKAARFVGSWSNEEGGAVTYLSQKQQSALRWLGKYVDVQELRLEDAIANLPGQVSKVLLTAGTRLLGGLAGFAGNTILTFLILFFLFRDGRAAIDNVASILPLSRDQAMRLLARIRDSVVANLYGMLAVGLAQGLLTGAALAVLRVPSPLLLGLTASICYLIPVVGTMLVWGPAAIYLMATGHLWKGIILIAWGSVVVGTIDNIIRPLVIGSRVELHPLLLLFAVLGGLQVFGLIGIFIGPAIVSVIGALVEMLREELSAPVPPATTTSIV
jgi:predicted PurR-regulated permease PerM